MPTYRVLVRVARALERALGRRLDLLELVSIDGSYPTPSVCRLVGCPGCLPDAVFEDDGRLREEYRNVEPGEWEMPPPVEIRA